MFQGHTVINLILTYRYIILFPLACVEGPVLALTIGFLVHLGYFNIWGALLLMCAGDFFPDIFYYYLGYIGNEKKYLEKYGSRFQLIKDNFPVIEKLWRDHGYKMMFFSKLAYGMSTPLLISSGLAKMPFRKFVSRALLVTIFQYSIILALGYYLGYSATFASDIKIVGLIFAVVLLVFIYIYIKVQKYAKAEMEKLEKREELEEKSKI